MGFLKGNNTFDFGKLKLGPVNINRIYLGSNYVWPPLAGLSCAIEGSAQGNIPLFSCAIEGSAQGAIPLFSCAIEGSATSDVIPEPIFTDTGVLTWDRNNFTLAVADVNLQRQQVLQASGLGGNENKRLKCSDGYKNIIIGSFVDNEIPYISNDYGASFYQPTGLPAIRFFNGTVFMSKSGKYIYAAATSSPFTLYRSSNFGLSFEQVTGTFPESYYFSSNIGVSHSGKELLLTLGNGSVDEKLYLSTNYGEDFLDITSRIYPSGNAPASAFEGCFVSGDGLLIGTLSGRSDETNKISTDFGQTWQEADFSLKTDWNTIESSYTGQYSLLEGSVTSSYANSSSLGLVYNSIPGGSMITSSISNLGQYAITYGNLNGNLRWYNSTNYLGSWQEITPSNITNAAWIFN